VVEVFGIIRWWKRFSNSKVVTNENNIDPKTLYEECVEILRSKEESHDGSKAGAWYHKFSLEQTRSWIVQANEYVMESPDMHWLMRFRTKSVWTAPRLSMVGMLPSEYQETCPCCKRDAVESIPHILFECKRWDDQRRKVATLISQIKRLTKDCVGEEVQVSDIMSALLLGGEYCGARLTNWLIERSHTESDPGFLRVARFLGEIMRLRSRIISPLITSMGQRHNGRTRSRSSHRALSK